MIPPEYLKRIRRVDIESRLRSEELMAGQSDSIFKGRGLEFVDVREYSPGDDVRRMDWNVSARQRRPYIRRLVEERELTVLILIDLSASGAFGTTDITKLELAAELAGTIAHSAMRNNDRVGMVLFTSEVEFYLPPRKSRQHLLHLLRNLLTHVPKREGTNIAAAMEFAARVTHRPSLMFVISDFHDQGYERALKSANQRHDLLALQLVDPREHTLPDAGWAVVRDAETGETLEVDTSDPEVRATYDRAAGERREVLRDYFRRARIGHLEVRTDQPWSRQFRAFLAHQARRVA